MMEHLPWWAVFGVLALAVGILLTIGFAAMCRINEQQEPQEQNNERGIMTIDEVVAAIDAENRELIAEKAGDMPELLALMNLAGMRGFCLGANTAGSIYQGAFAVAKARVGK